MAWTSSLNRDLRYLAIRGGLDAIALTRLGRLFPSRSGRGLIFTLHHVRPQTPGKTFDPNGILSITPDFLEVAVRTTLGRGLVPVHLHDLPALLADPDDKRRFVAFTLDDGYRNNAEFAAPIFRKFGIPYTIFITRGFVERARTMWWETNEAIVRAVEAIEFDFGSGLEVVPSATNGQKRAAFDRFARFMWTVDEDEAVRRIDETARNHGIDPMKIVRDEVMDENDLRALSRDPLVHFGAHTLSHCNLRCVDDDRLRQEIVASAAAVERYVGVRPRSFAYPYGWPTATGEREAQAVARAGFDIAVTTQPGVLSRERLRHQPMLMPRVSLNGNFQKRRYVDALISGLPFR